MTEILMQAQFQLFGLAHWGAILTTAILAASLTYLARRGMKEVHLKRLRFTMGTLLITAVTLDPILTLKRYGMGEMGWDLVVNNSLPFYLCDVVSVLLALALFTKNQRLAEIGYLWGLAGTVQGLITPTLWFGWGTIEFYVFFLQHGGVPVAAIFLVWGLHIVPEKGAFRRAIFWSLGYMAIVMSFNFATGENYGFLNGTPEVPTLFDHMGPWPYYLLTLQVIAYTLYAILLAIAPKKKSA